MHKIIDLFRKSEKQNGAQPQVSPNSAPAPIENPSQVNITSSQLPVPPVKKHKRLYYLLSILAVTTIFAGLFLWNKENFTTLYYDILPYKLWKYIPFPNVFKNKSRSTGYNLTNWRYPSPQPTPTTIERNKISVDAQYTNREKVFEAVKFPENDNDYYYSFEFYKVGKIISGEFSGGDLILALVTETGACKGRGCWSPLRLRYIIKENKAIFLPNISNPSLNSYPQAVFDPRVHNPFSKFGLSLSVNEDITIPILEYPTDIIGDQPSQILRLESYNNEEDGLLDQSKLDVAFVHNLFGNVYTTKSDLAPDEGFYIETSGIISVPDASDVEGCNGQNCFLTNAFFVFRPDGTFIKFYYSPPFQPEDIIWSDQITTEEKYISRTVGGCDWMPYDYISVVSPDLVNNDELNYIGKVSTTGESIYGLKNAEHKLYTDFYDKYSKNYLDLKQFAYNDFYKNDEPDSYQEFLGSRPLFLWQDPFARLIRFSNIKYLPPSACEPIIYLYPEQKQEVTVKLGNNVRVTDSTPNYSSGWKIVAQPSGSLEELLGGRIYPYLFWEGHSYIFPMRKDGYVVKKNNVEGLFTEILPKLGLNNKEAGDFLEAWLPHFRNSPYYFITFLQNDELDKIFPLEITPKPDTVIRILMDYRALDQPIDVPEFKIRAAAPIREGFTVVEWGGLKRSF